MLGKISEAQLMQMTFVELSHGAIIFRSCPCRTVTDYLCFWMMIIINNDLSETDFELCLVNV